MSRKITRRKALAAGAVTSSMLFSSAGSRKAHTWSPDPDKNLVRDLTPGPTPIRIAMKVFDRKNESPEETVRRIRKMGYTSINTQPSQWTDAELVEMRAALKKYDVTVFEVGVYTNIIHHDRATRQKNLKRAALRIEEADKIGCPMVGTCTGTRDTGSYIGMHPDNWTKETWKLTVDSVKQILRDTAGMKAALGIEAQVTTNIDSPKAHRRLIDDVGDPRCVVNLDPVNMCCLANYYHTTELINECFDLLGENILGCHAKDTYIWPDQQTVHVQEVCPGKGVMDYEMFLVRMSRMKWPRALCHEHLEPDEYSVAKEYIEKVAAKVGVKIYS